MSKSKSQRPKQSTDVKNTRSNSNVTDKFDKTDKIDNNDNNKNKIEEINKEIYQSVWKKLDIYFHNNLLKKTKTRVMVANYFIKLGESKHVSAEQVYYDLNDNDKNAKVALATIYRCINLLVKAKVLIQHNFHNLNSVFELAYPFSHHDHLVCLDCGKIKEFEDELIEQQQLTIAKNLGFNLEFHKLELFGKCTLAQCEQKTKQDANKALKST